MVLITLLGRGALLLLLLLLFALLCRAVICLLVGWHRERQHRLRLFRRLGLPDSGDGVGCSLLLHNPASAELPARLLEAESASFEVVAVIDGESKPALLQESVALFSLIRVEYRPAEEFAAFGVRALYRSSRRAYSRLILLDATTPNRAEAWSAAAAVASYEWLLPLGGDTPFRLACLEELLLRVEQLEQPPRVGCISLCGLHLIARDEVLLCGGFGPELWRRLRLPLMLRYGSKGTKRRKRVEKCSLLS